MPHVVLFVVAVVEVHSRRLSGGALRADLVGHLIRLLSPVADAVRCTRRSAMGPGWARFSIGKTILVVRVTGTTGAHIRRVSGRASRRHNSYIGGHNETSAPNFAYPPLYRHAPGVQWPDGVSSHSRACVTLKAGRKAGGKAGSEVSIPQMSPYHWCGVVPF
jgi:hypothetical protein